MFYDQQNNDMLSYEGNKVRLRPLQFADIQRTIVWRNDPEIRDQSLSYRFPVTEVMEENWYRKILTGEDQSKVFFAIENKDDRMHIGVIHLYDIDYIASNAYFSIVIGDKTHHSKGKARDAMHILFKFAFNHLNLHKINLEVASFNHKALKLYAIFGFIQEGLLKQQIFLCGKFHDKHCMGIFRDSYFEKYPPKTNIKNQHSEDKLIVSSNAIH